VIVGELIRGSDLLKLFRGLGDLTALAVIATNRDAPLVHRLAIALTEYHKNCDFPSCALCALIAEGLAQEQ
jgi:hypothetical protein